MDSDNPSNIPLQPSRPGILKRFRTGYPRLFFLTCAGLLIWLTWGSLYFAVLLGAFGPLPAEDELARLRLPQAAEIYTRDSVLLGRYYLQERVPVTYDEISSHVVDALVATEDARFYQHSGLDRLSLMRVFFKSILLQDGRSGGGSTISQQLAKNLFPRQQYPVASILVNKLRETFIARRLEGVFSKEEILTQYLNTVTFGENTFGIRIASNRFFSQPPDSLKAEQAAMLIGMLKATTAYNPRLYPESALKRRNVVLNQMEKYGYLSMRAADSLKLLPMEINMTYSNHHKGPAPYFREHIRPELDQWCRTHFKADGSPYNLYLDGLKIYTTLDFKLQQYAETATQEHMQRLQKIFDNHARATGSKTSRNPAIKEAIQQSRRHRTLTAAGKSKAFIDSVMKEPVPMRVFDWKEGVLHKELSPLDSILHYKHLLQAGFLAMDPMTGHIKAWVGGIDHRFFQYDHVTSNRQTGSTFKPIVYAAALENGVDPCEYISNEKVVFEEYDDWAPRNSDESYGGEYSMQGGLTHSVNVVSVNLIMKIGPKKVLDFAQKTGIQHQLPAVPSLALGAAEVSLLELVNSYCTLANHGKYIAPTWLYRIEDRTGQVLMEQSEPIETQQACSAETADMIVHMLKGVVNKGTAAGLRSRYGLTQDIAGKTGTTQAQADGWFLGMTPRLVAGAWAGADDRRIHFRSLKLGQGAATAMPIYGRFMQKVAKDPTFAAIKKARFKSPPQAVLDQLDCDPFQFLLPMSAFREWWAKQKEEKEAQQAAQP